MGGSFKASSPNRRRADYYPSPWTLVKQLLDVEKFPNHILEPCCGEARSIVGYLKSKNKTVTAYDLWCGPEDERRDFLCETHEYPAIITNPPFSLADRFVETSIRCSRKTAMFLPLDYLHGKSRYKKFYNAGITPARVYVFVRRPNLSGELYDDGCYGTGSVTFAWFIWERGYDGPTTIGWIDNTEYVR